MSSSAMTVDAGWRPLTGSADIDRRTGWRRHAPRESKALVTSVIVHAAIFAAFFVSFDFKPPLKPENKLENTISVSLQPGDGPEVSIPKASVETAQVEEKAEEPVPQPVEQSEPDPVEQPVEKPVETQPDPQPRPQQPSQPAAPANSSDSAPSATKVGGSGEMIWTPPAPGSIASGIQPDGKPRVEKRVEMPKVELPKGASEPVLLSYDQGRFNDAATMSEASRLLNTGTITMAVNVDDKGKVTSCTVTSTSGSRMLDERGCLLVQSYEYRPAQDQNGKVHAAIVTEVLEWARDGKFVSSQTQTGEALDAVRNAEKAMPKATPRPSMPVVRMPERR